MATTETNPVAGKFSKKANKAPGMSSCSTTVSTRPPWPLSSIWNAEWPKIPNHMTEKPAGTASTPRSEEHTSELQSRGHLVCRLLLEKKNLKPTASADT